MPAVPAKVQAQACLDALITLYAVEARQTAPTPVERQRLAGFPGFGCLALDLFPDPVTGQYKDAGWEALGTQLEQALPPEDYASAARSTYTQFFTPTLIMRALFLGLKHAGVPNDVTVLEPGVGSGRFLGCAPAGMQCLGIEQDRLSGRIARLLYPQHEIRIANLQREPLDPESVEAIIGNVPFSQEKTPYWGRNLSLHELCVAKSVDALRPGGVLALVVTHSLLDRQQAHFRRALDQRAAFLGAIRLPSTAFAAEGTHVVADLLFLLKREAPLVDPHGEKAWLETTPVEIEGVQFPINTHFQDNPAMVLGTWSRKDRLYGHSYSVTPTGALAEQLARAILRLPKQVYSAEAPLCRTPRVVPPSTPVPLGEGSLCVQAGQICQQQAGQAVPVLQGGKPVTVTGGVGRRVAHLIALRDLACDVLRQQRDGATHAVREAARAALRSSYDAFVGRYGPVNTLVISARADGTLVRRTPNLQLFKDLDPDAMRVMALEHYHERTGTAILADLFRQDVVAPEAPLTQVDSAAEALLVVLNATGEVDLQAVADLCGLSAQEVVEELDDLLYHDPASGRWETSDVYLSGDVKTKLAEAERATQQDGAYTRNVTALTAVQPPDLLPSDIEAQLGSPWIPVDMIQDFACETFALGAWHLRVAHQPHEALWNIDPTWTARNCDLAQVTYGTSRVDGVTLLQQSLNLQFPTVTDPVTDLHGNTKYVRNEVETLAAHEKQDQLKARFQTWLWQDATRAERCVRLYNALRNRHRARQMNGDHLTFPGMSQLITLTAAQKAAVWRIITQGNTYLGHATGGGKTYSMIAAGMKMTQMGLMRKPLYVVKNNTLEQFAQMALELYPEGRFLIAGPDDFHRDRRKLLAAQMASNCWDGIIITHSSFQHLGLSAAFQEQVLREQVDDYSDLLLAHARAHGNKHSNIRKVLEKALSTYESRLEILRDIGTKDDGLLFDELGIGGLFIDEAHYARKLETPTKLQRTAGVQSAGSGRAFDLYMKVRYLHQQRPGHGVVFASATPVCNTLGELYGIQRMLTPDALETSGITHFDAWAATFGVVEEKLELGPDGETLRPRVRLGDFTNLPELQQMLGQFMDVQTAEHLSLPVPQLAGGKPTEVVVPLSPLGRMVQADLVERYGAVRKGQGRSRGEALCIMSEGRKLGVDVRLVLDSDEDGPDSKLSAVAQQIHRLWQEGQADRSTQLVFCDVGVNPTAWGFGAYTTLIQKCVALGMPPEELARMDEATNDLKRYRLFQQVQQGSVRVLLGSTERLGTGANVQERLVAVHHVDVPLLPNEIEQRNGRILRQGNLHRDWGKPVHIYYYGTAGSVEATFWQILQSKAHFTHQFLSGASTERKAADIGEQELSFATMKAIVAGNPAFRVLAETDAELRRLHLLAKHDQDVRFQAQRVQRELPGDLAREEAYLAKLQADQAMLERWSHRATLTLEGQLRPSAIFPLTGPEAMRALDAMAEPLMDTTFTQQTRLGTYKGLRFGLATSNWTAPEVWLEGQVTRRASLTRRTRPGVGIVAALREIERDLPVRVAQAQRHLGEVAQRGQTAQAQLAQPWTLGPYQKELHGLRQALEAALTGDGDRAVQEEVVQQIERLRAAHRTQQGPQVARTATTVPMAESVVGLIQRQLEAQQEGGEPAAAD
jgi:N12 class adenine-specific DNA methylase